MSDATDMFAGVIVEIGLASIVLGVIYRFWGTVLGLPKPTKVQPFQRGVLMKGESLDRIVGPGTHWISPKKTIFLCDVRPKPFQLNLQDVQVAPSRWVRLSLRGATVITDPARFVMSSSDSLSTLYTAIRRLLTEAARGCVFDANTESNVPMTQRMRELLDGEAETLGMIVTSLDIWEILPLFTQEPEEEVSSLPIQ